MTAGYIPAMPRLGLPAIHETDAGQGVARPAAFGDGDTALPAGLAAAASFDPQVAYDGGVMIGSEAHRMGFGVLLGGGMDLVRDPRNGRNFEYAGEDPLLAGSIVGAAIRGIQSQRSWPFFLVGPHLLLHGFLDAVRGDNILHFIPGYLTPQGSEPCPRHPRWHYSWFHVLQKSYPIPTCR